MLDLPIAPHGPRLIVAPVYMPSAIILTERVRKLDPPERAVVLAVGDAPDPPCAVGDMILHKHRAGTDLTVDGKRVTVMAWDDVRAIIRD